MTPTTWVSDLGAGLVATASSALVADSMFADPVEGFDVIDMPLADPQPQVMDFPRVDLGEVFPFLSPSPAPVPVEPTITSMPFIDPHELGLWGPMTAGVGAPMTPDQVALKDLVDEVTLGGRRPLTVDEADTVLDWADEVAYPGCRASAGCVGVLSPWVGGPHIHIPGAGRPGGHVPVERGLLPR